MLGGVFGSMFMLKHGHADRSSASLLTLLGCAIIGVITEFVAVRPVLKSLDQHLYVLVHAGAGADDPAGGGDRMGHRTATVSRG